MARKAKNGGVKLSSVLAFEKKIVPSDGYMYSVIWDKRNDVFSRNPVNIIEKSVRGTISNRLKGSEKSSTDKLDAKVEVPNLQTVDSASLPVSDDTLVLNYTIKFLPGAEIPSACNEPEHFSLIKEMGQRYIEKYGCRELARRYAMNIANGRFLWRNRVGAEQIEIIVKDNKSNMTWAFNAYDFALKDFDKGSELVEDLSSLIADALAGKRAFLLLNVEAYVKLGKGQEVYPSEELVLDKEKSNKSKILYEKSSIAAIHSQKIGNAIRTIDTWYPAYGEDNEMPIAIEPYGAVTNLGKAFRTPKEEKDFYTLFDKYSSGNLFENEEDAHYVMAVLVRGGVFGQASKE